MSTETVRVTIELTRRDHEISGSVVPDGEAGQSFSGWLALMSLLQAMVESDPELGEPPV